MLSVPKSPPQSDCGLCYRWILDSDSSATSVTPEDGAGTDPKPLPPGVEPLTARLLAARGFKSAKAISDFLHPSLTMLHDPGLLPGMDAAARRILDALKRGERLVIYGDYDVDGVTSAAILYHTIRKIAPDANLDIYVPHRVNEGYGLNTPAIEQIINDGAELIVSVDCGITALEQAALAKKRGVDLIITDHHHPLLPDSQGISHLPDAYTIVHPGIPGSQYPFRELCGAGVAYKLAWRLATMHEARRQLSAPLREVMLELLALAAMGTVADVVPLVDENRAIVHHGLARLNKSKLHGLRALINSCGYGEGPIDAERIGFGLAPRLNACGRLGHAMHAVRLLTQASQDEAVEIAEYLDTQNKARRDLEKKIADHACELAEAGGMTGSDRRAIVLAHETWHTGVIGIVCSRLVNRYGRPTLLLANDGAKLSGSGRSIPGFDLHGALHACAEHLISFGGHTAAAGLSLHLDNLEAFTHAFTAYANDHIEDDGSLPELRYDLRVDLTELTTNAVEQLGLLGPYGQGNPPVSLRIDGLRLIEPPKLMGQRSNHLSLRAQSGQRVMRLVGWNWGEYAPQLVNGMTFDAVVTPKLNSWQGRNSIEPEILDLRLDT